MAFFEELEGRGTEVVRVGLSRPVPRIDEVEAQCGSAKKVAGVLEEGHPGRARQHCDHGCPQAWRCEPVCGAQHVADRNEDGFVSGAGSRDVAAKVSVEPVGIGREPGEERP